MSTTYTVECPNCKHQMQLSGDYSENLDTECSCSKCKWTASGYNFDYIKSTIEGDDANGGK